MAFNNMVEEAGVVIWQRTLRNIDRCTRFRSESDKEIRSSDPESEISGSTADATPSPAPKPDPAEALQPVGADRDPVSAGVSELQRQTRPE